MPTDIALGRQAEAARRHAEEGRRQAVEEERAQAEEERWAQAAVRDTLSKANLSVPSALFAQARAHSVSIHRKI